MICEIIEADRGLTILEETTIMLYVYVNQMNRQRLPAMALAWSQL